MQDLTTIEFKGETVTVTELTVKQVRQTFERVSKEDIPFIDDLVNRKVPALIVTECTGLTVDQLEDAKPSELDVLFDKVAEINPSLASMIQRRIEALDRIMAKKNSEPISTEPFAH